MVSVRFACTLYLCKNICVAFSNETHYYETWFLPTGNGFYHGKFGIGVLIESVNPRIERQAHIALQYATRHEGLYMSREDSDLGKMHYLILHQQKWNDLESFEQLFIDTEGYILNYRAGSTFDESKGIFKEMHMRKCLLRDDLPKLVYELCLDFEDILLTRPIRRLML